MLCQEISQGQTVSQHRYKNSPAITALAMSRYSLRLVTLSLVYSEIVFFFFFFNASHFGSLLKSELIFHENLVRLARTAFCEDYGIL